MGTKGLPAELKLLRIYKGKAIERMAENEIVIGRQNTRIAELEGVLKRMRAHVYDIYRNTIGVVRDEYAPEPKAAKSGRKPKP